MLICCVFIFPFLVNTNSSDLNEIVRIDTRYGRDVKICRQDLRPILSHNIPRACLIRTTFAIGSPVWAHEKPDWLRVVCLIAKNQSEASNPNLHVAITHARHVCSQHSFGFPLLIMNGMHRTQSDHARFVHLSHEEQERLTFDLAHTPYPMVVTSTKITFIVNFWDCVFLNPYMSQHWPTSIFS